MSLINSMILSLSISLFLVVTVLSVLLCVRVSIINVFRNGVFEVSFMFTLTYNDESLVYTDVGDYSYPIPLLSDIQNMFKIQ